MSDSDELIMEMERSLEEIEMLMDSVRVQAEFNNMDPFRMMDANGMLMMIPLVAAKAHILPTLLTLRKEKEDQINFEEVFGGIKEKIVEAWHQARENDEKKED